MTNGRDNSPQPADITQTQHPSGTAGTTIGPYRLLERIGEGGMGEVWLAEQTQPVRRQVALKLIKPGMDTGQVIARFEAERQALALMDHPAIAKVLDAGATAQGRPFFAMEFVRGESLTAYCDRQRLTTRERLELFLQVCEGVQHAHQKGIIHRDLKPSNILVAVQDDRPVPKIIDFGLVKAMSQPLTDRTLYTALAGFVGTPEYMSPEQAEMGGVDIDTRTDVYALGVVLYELLTGLLPFDRQLFRDKGLDEIRHTIREVEPPRPSTRITQPGTTSADAAMGRGTESGHLARLLRGDLDWITMKALAKDRTRRYGAASDLAADIRRHIASQPVLAGPPSAVYRSRKFIRRHRFGVAVASVLVVLLTTFAVAMTIQAQQIAAERDRANMEAETAKQVSSFLVGLFEVSKPNETTANSLTARQILDSGADRITKEGNIPPPTRATLLATMGEVYSSLGLYAKAHSLHEDALAVRREVLGSRSPATAASMARVGSLLGHLGKVAEAEQLQREALAVRLSLFGNDHVDVADSQVRLARVLRERAQYHEAESLYLQAIPVQRRLLGDSPVVGRALRGLGGLRLSTADFVGAERVFREAQAIHAKVLGPGHPETLADADNVATAVLLQGRYAEAEAVYRENLTETVRTHGREHPEVGTSLMNLGAALFYQKRYVEAESSYREALAIARWTYGNQHPEVARCLVNLAESLNAQARYPEALEAAEEGLAMARQSVGGEHPIVAKGMVYRSQALLGVGRIAHADASAREAVEIIRQKLGPDHPETIEAELNLSAALLAGEKWSEVEPLLLRLAAVTEAANQSDEFSKVVRQIDEMYTARGKPDRSAEWRAKLPQ